MKRLEALARHPVAIAGAMITTAELPHADDIASIYLVVSLAEGAAYHAKTLEQCPELYDPSVRLRAECCRTRGPRGSRGGASPRSP